MDIPEPFSPQPIDGGWCIAVVDEQRCIDVLSMLYNFRVVETLRSVNGGHSFYQRGWCYQGTGTVAFLRVLAALKAWDGSTNTEPQGWIKRTHPVTA